jgi:hypothetical protein
MTFRIGRREFITLLSGAAAAVLIQRDQLAFGSGLGPSQGFCSWDTR